ncbi:MAG TPA: hypothetical protein VGQ13_02740 [Nitrososphaera sp.]|jgi:hypothetical protein|nr:hypothetical protein [Nitrososphaera sp.]
MSSIPYARFPVLETIEIREVSDIRHAVDMMVKAYIIPESQGKFSYRILLPRDQKSTSKTKRIGLAFQGEFMLGLRKHNIVPKVREVRYIHDESHYGWLLANPEVYERFSKGTS